MILYVAIILLGICIDQHTKWLAVVCLRGNESLPLIKDVFHFSYVENTGAAFGMLKNSRWVFIVISTAAIIALLVYIIRHAKNMHRLCGISLSLIIAGGVGNMIDRLFLGYVVDFLDFTLIDFAVFNVADSCITVGAVLLAIYILFFYGKGENKNAVEGGQGSGGNKA